jgi:VWFA-related protein
MRRIRGFAQGALAALLASGLAAAAIAQSPTPAPEPLFIDTVSVNIVNVEVFVRSKDGVPVVGLGPADFEVFEDGDPMEITNFFAATTPAPPATATQGTGPEATPIPEAPPEPIPASQRLSLIFFIDNANISPGQRRFAFANLQTLLREAMRSTGTRAMLVTGGNRVNVRQAFTQDVPALVTALAEAERDVGDSATLNVDRTMILRLLDQTAPPGGGEGRAGSQLAVEDAHSILEQVRRAAEAEYERTRWILSALRNFVDSLSGIEGRKVVFFVGGGISMRPGQGLLERWESRFGLTSLGRSFNAVAEANRYDLTSTFNDLVKHANAYGVTFYSIDALGNRGLANMTSETKTLYLPGVGTGEALSAQQSLQVLASATGGRLAVNSPDMSQQIAKTVEDFDTFYSLGYAAPHEGDGKYHRITVKVRRPGVGLRYREGYLDRPADDRMADRSMSALLFGAGSNSLDAELSVRAQVKQPDGTYLVTLLVTVPLSKLTLLPRGQVHEGTLSFWLTAKDADGEHLTQVPKQSFPVRVPNEKLLTVLGQRAGCTFQLRTDSGPKRVAVSIRDDLGQTQGTTSAEFNVGDAAGDSRPASSE